VGWTSGGGGLGEIEESPGLSAVGSVADHTSFQFQVSSFELLET